MREKNIIVDLTVMSLIFVEMLLFIVNYLDNQ